MGRGKWEWGRVVSVQPSPRSKGDLYDVDLEIVLTGQDAPGPPAPPYTGNAFAGLQQSSNDNSAGGNHGYLKYQTTYAIGSPGWATQVDDGPIACDPPTTYPVIGDRYDSITVSATMYVRIYARAWWSGNIGHVTITLNVLVNGVVVGTASKTDYSNFILVDLRNYPLQDGDVVSVLGSPNSTFWSNTGINGTQLIVGRGAYPFVPLAAPAGSTFVGP